MGPTQPASFGVLLKRFRVAADLSQDQLAERAGVGSHTISDLERGARRTPHWQTARQLADALGLSSHERERFEAAARKRRASSSASFQAPVDPDDRLLLPAATRQLIGRREELALVDRHLAREGPPVLVLAGEPGIGKTRLLEEAARSAVGYGFTVLQGGCQRRSGQEPYAPLLDALAGQIQQTSHAEMKAALHNAIWMVRLLPELAKTVQNPGPLPREHESRLIFESVARFLANVAGPAGTLLLLDDLQWAGTDGLDLLGTLARRASGIPLRVVGAYRTTEVSRSDSLGVMLADLAHARLVQQRMLGPLDSSDALQLLQSLLAGSDAVGEDAQLRVVQRTGGVPFFLVSCAYALRGRAFGGSPSEELPWDVTHAILQRLAVQPEPVQAVLRIAAIIGRVVPHDLLVTVAGLPESEVAASVDDACQAQLLVAQGTSDYRFVHDVIREAIEADIGTARRRYLHHRVAVGLEGQAEPARSKRAAELAWHFAEANDPERALRWGMVAGDEAEHVFAHGEAESHYRAAARHAEAVGDRHGQLEAEVKLGQTLRLMARYEEARAVLEAAAQAYGERGDFEGQLLVMAAIGWILAAQNQPEAAIAQLEPVLKRWRSNPVATAGSASLHTVLATLHRNFGRIAEALPLAQRAVELAIEVGDEGQLGLAESQLGWVLSNVGRSDEALAAFTRAIPLLERAGDLRSLGETLINRAITHDNARLAAEARADGLRAIEVTRRLGDPATLAFVLAANAWGAWFSDGDSQRTRSFLDQLAPLEVYLRGTSNSGHVALAEWLRLVIGADTDSMPGSLERLAKEADAGGDRLLWQLSRLWLGVWDVLCGRAQSAVQRIEDIPDDVINGRWETWGALPSVVEAYVKCGRLQEAANLVGNQVETLRHQEGRPARGLDRVRRVDARVADGRLWVAKGHWDEARAALEEALSLTGADEGGPSFSRAIAAQAYGEMLAERGDLDDARQRLQEAGSIFRRMNARPYLERTERDLATLQSRAADKTT